MTAMTDIQDMLAVMVTLEKRNIDFRVYIIDCLVKKRQFYRLDVETWVANISNFLFNNTRSKSLLDIQKKFLFFGITDEAKFVSEYEKYLPDYVFLQNIYHKHPAWIPYAEKSKVIMLSMHHDTASQIENSYYKVAHNFTRRFEENKYYTSNPPTWFLRKTSKNAIKKNGLFRTTYPGNLRAELLNLNYELPACNKKEEYCLIVATQYRKNDNYEAIISLANKTIQIAKKRGIKVYWKARMKGHPYDSKVPFIDDMNYKPDLVITDDLDAPPMLYSLSKNATACFTMQTSTAYWDLQKINNNSAMLIPDPPGEREPGVIDRYYKFGDKEIEQTNIFYLSEPDTEMKINNMLSNGVSINKEYINNNKNTSTNLLKSLGVIKS